MKFSIFTLTILLLWNHTDCRRQARVQKEVDERKEEVIQERRSNTEEVIQYTTLPTVIYGPTYSYETVPETAFTCRGKSLGGYYADTETECQMFHICNVGSNNQLQDLKFLCANGTVFDQRKLVCQDSRKVRCAGSERFYRKGIPLDVQLRTALEDEHYRQEAALIDLQRRNR